MKLPSKKNLSKQRDKYQLHLPEHQKKNQSRGSHWLLKINHLTDEGGKNEEKGNHLPHFILRIVNQFPLVTWRKTTIFTYFSSLFHMPSSTNHQNVIDDNNKEAPQCVNCFIASSSKKIVFFKYFFLCFWNEILLISSRKQSAIQLWAGVVEWIKIIFPVFFFTHHTQFPSLH